MNYSSFEFWRVLLWEAQLGISTMHRSLTVYDRLAVIVRMPQEYSSARPQAKGASVVIQLLTVSLCDSAVTVCEHKDVFAPIDSFHHVIERKLRFVHPHPGEG